MLTDRTWRLPFAVVFVALIGCGPSPSTAPSAEPTASTAATSLPTIVVTSEFLLQAGKRIAGEHFDVRRIVPDSTTSPNWRPRRADIETMRAARLIVMNGAGYEPWKDRVSLPDSRVLDSSAGYRDQLIRIPDAVTHQHGPDGKHSHAGFVSATWLDPVLAAAQLTELEKTLAGLQPDLKLQFARETSPLKAQLEAISRDLDSLKAQIDPAKFVVASDSAAVSYFTRRLGVELRYLHWETPDAPTDEDRTELQAMAKEQPESKTKRIFLLNSRCPDAAEAWAKEAGFEVARIDLLEYPGSAGPADASELINRMNQNLTRISIALKATAE